MELIGPAPLTREPLERPRTHLQVRTRGVDANPWSGHVHTSKYVREVRMQTTGRSIDCAHGRSSLILLFHCTNGADRTGHIE
jgi:hypothetical protein